MSKKPLLNLNNDINNESNTDENIYNNSFFKLIGGKIINKFSKLFVKKNIIKIKPLSPSDRNNLKQAGFGIFLVAFILTIFEILFFYKVVIPGVNSSRDGGLRNLGQLLASNLNKTKNKLKLNISEIEPLTEEKLLNFYYGTYYFIFNPERINEILPQPPQPTEFIPPDFDPSIEITLPDDWMREQGNNFPYYTTTATPTTAAPTTATPTTRAPTTRAPTTATPTTTEGFDSNPLIVSINNSDLSQNRKNDLIHFIKDPEDFQIKKKKLILKILDSDLPEINPILETAAYREGLLRKKINSYVFITGLLIIFILLMFLLKIRKSIIKDTHFNVFRAGYTTAKITAVITLLCLIAFQYSFYLLGKKYLFTISGIKMCNNYDIESFIKIMKIKGKTFTKTEAKEYIFTNTVKGQNKYFDVNFPGDPSVCESNGGLSVGNNKCTRRFYQCHYLNEEKDKYGNGNNELELLALSKV